MTIQSIEKRGPTVRGISVVVGSNDLFGMLGLQTELEQMGLRVAGCAADPAQAVRAAQALSPGAVILDAGPNRQDALDAARRIIGERIAPVLLLLPPADSAFVRSALEAGVDGFLSRPINPSAIVSTIEIAVAKWSAMRETEKRITRMESQLATREVIGSAKFRLMERHGWREAEAYRYMQTLSMNSRKPMSVVAGQILAGIRAGAALNFQGNDVAA